VQEKVDTKNGSGKVKKYRECADWTRLSVDGFTGDLIYG
jgi:hypothetical protein